MEEDLMGITRGRVLRSPQAGFSMIEMLMTTFILAIGLLGLCMLQTMALRGGRGSRSLTTAVHVATAALDQVEMEGRLSWLNITDSPLSGQTNSSLNLIFIPLLHGTSSNAIYFNLQGNPTDINSTDPTINDKFFTVIIKHVDDVGNGAGVGQVSDYTATVTFSDTVNASQSPVTRTVVLTRRITHG